MCVFDSSPLSTFRVMREKLDDRMQGSWWQGYGNDELNVLEDFEGEDSCSDDDGTGAMRMDDVA